MLLELKTTLQKINFSHFTFQIKFTSAPENKPFIPESNQTVYPIGNDFKSNEGQFENSLNEK